MFNNYDQPCSAHAMTELERQRKEEERRHLGICLRAREGQFRCCRRSPQCDYGRCRRRLKPRDAGRSEGWRHGRRSHRCGRLNAGWLSRNLYGGQGFPEEPQEAYRALQQVRHGRKLQRGIAVGNCM